MEEEISLEERVEALSQYMNEAQKRILDLEQRVASLESEKENRMLESYGWRNK